MFIKFEMAVQGLRKGPKCVGSRPIHALDMTMPFANLPKITFVTQIVDHSIAQTIVRTSGHGVDER